jgi:ribosomal protein S18 acetylase RimI-like enzyme
MNLNISPPKKDQAGPRPDDLVPAEVPLSFIHTSPAGIARVDKSRAIWFPPGMQAWPVELVAKLKLLPLFLTLCGFGRMRRGGTLSDAMERAHPQEPHFYLYFLAVDPALQGMGLGSRILDATLKRIDEMGLSAYLENSNPRNTRSYERAGFLARKNIAPEGAPPLIPMWRAVSQYC